MKLRGKLIFLIVTVSAATTFGWLFFLAGVRFSEYQRGTQASAYRGAYFEFRGKKFGASDLSPDAQHILEEAEKKATQAHFSADFDLYREREQVARTELATRRIHEEAERTGRDAVTLKDELLKVTEPTRDEARDLFVASDPGASPKEFEKLQPSLLAYIGEVSRREAFEKFVARLDKENVGRVLVPRPYNESVRFAVDNFPHLGSNTTGHTVVAFVDYFCDGCEKYNVEFSMLAQDYSDSALFVFIPFPFTRPDKSLALARGSLCANEQNKFLDFHMAAVRQGGLVSESTVFDLAGAAGLDSSAFLKCYVHGSSVGAALQLAQLQATNAGVMRTPVTFFDGKLYEGMDALSELRKRIESARPLASR